MYNASPDLIARFMEGKEMGVGRGKVKGRKGNELGRK